MYGTKTRKLAVGIDFDDTITLAPEMFEKIIEVFKSGGFDVYIVTARNSDTWCELLLKFKPLVENVIFCSGKAKCDIVEVDIWIDDFPLAITHDFKSTKWVTGEEAAKWT